jgi:hypothetical protein
MTIENRRDQNVIIWMQVHFTGEETIPEMG